MSDAMTEHYRNYAPKTKRKPSISSLDKECRKLLKLRDEKSKYTTKVKELNEKIEEVELAIRERLERSDKKRWQQGEYTFTPMQRTYSTGIKHPEDKRRALEMLTEQCNEPFAWKMFTFNARSYDAYRREVEENTGTKLPLLPGMSEPHTKDIIQVRKGPVIGG